MLYDAKEVWYVSVLVGGASEHAPPQDCLQEISPSAARQCLAMPAAVLPMCAQEVGAGQACPQPLPVGLLTKTPVSVLQDQVDQAEESRAESPVLAAQTSRCEDSEGKATGGEGYR